MSGSNISHQAQLGHNPTVWLACHCWNLLLLPHWAGLRSFQGLEFVYLSRIISINMIWPINPCHSHNHNHNPSPHSQSLNTLIDSRRNHWLSPLLQALALFTETRQYFIVYEITKELWRVGLQGKYLFYSLFKFGSTSISAEKRSFSSMDNHQLEVFVQSVQILRCVGHSRISFSNRFV